MSQNNWFSWLNAEPLLLKTCHAITRLLIYGCIGVSILNMIVYVPDVEKYVVPTAQHVHIQIALVISMMSFIVIASRLKPAVVKLGIFYFFLFVGGAAVFVTEPNLVDTPFQLILCCYALGKATAALLELFVLAWALGPSSAPSGSRAISSRARLLSPRRCPFIASRLVIVIARMRADVLALIYLGLCAVLSGLLSIPLSVAVAVLVAIALMLLTGRLSYVHTTAAASTNAISDTLTSATAQSVIVTTLLLSCVLLAHAALGGEWPRERRRFAYSKTKFVWQTLSLNSLHNWLVMNVSVARYLAEKSAVEDLPEMMPRVKYHTIERSSQQTGSPEHRPGRGRSSVAHQVNVRPAVGSSSQGPISPGALTSAAV